jgi:PAS domain S-box-containing protein
MKKTLLFVSILLILLTSVGFGVTKILGKENKWKLHAVGVESLSTQIDQIINQRLMMAKRLATNTSIIDSLQQKHGAPGSRLSFNIANVVANTELIYVINKDGTVMASSDSPKSPLVGRNYNFRPYFQESIQGKVTIFPAVGVFTKERGMHLSVPIIIKNRAKPEGVLVIKIGISEVENILNKRAEKTAIISPDGIIFSSNQPQWLFHATKLISETTMSRLNESRQFDEQEIKPLQFSVAKRFASIDGKIYHIARSPMTIPGWEILSLQDIGVPTVLPALDKILIFLSLSVTGSLALLTFFLMSSIQRRKKTEIMLIQAEKKYRSIFENAVMGIFQSLPIGRFVAANPSMAFILGYDSPQELINSVDDIEQSLYSSPDDRKTWLKQLAEHGHLNNYITQFKRKNGELIWVSLSCRLAQSLDGEGTFIEGFCFDVTEKITAQKEVEIQRSQLIHADKMISIGTLTAGVAHEINNPNTYIISSAEVLAEAWKQASYILDRYYEEQGEDFYIAGMPYTTFKENFPSACERIIDGSRRINRIIKELLDFSRREASVTSELVDINKIVTSAEALLLSTIKKSTNNFSMQLDCYCPKINANFHRVEQVVINIIQNACQSLSSKDKAIRVKTYYQQNSNEVVISCQDEGVGIPLRNLSLITEPFFTTKRDISGTGLGLAISSSIMREFNGTMSFESKEGEGTTVYLCFPASHITN